MQSITPNLRHPTIEILKKCKTITTLKQVHAQMLTNGFTLHTFPLSKLLHCSSTLSIPYALSIFNSITNPSIFLFNTLISSLITHHHNYTTTHIVFSLYTHFLYHNGNKSLVKPNSYTFPPLFKACSIIGNHDLVCFGREIHTHVLKFLEPPYDQFVQASLIHFYAHWGKIEVYRYIFYQFDKPDLGMWNSILKAYVSVSNTSCNGVSVNVDEGVSLSLEALFLFSEMQMSLIRPNEITLVALISACADLGALSHGLWLHVYILKNNLTVNRFVGTALIDMYSKCGCLDLAYQLFDQLPQRDTSCYNAMIGGFATHGYGHRAVELFEKMKVEGLVPDDVTLVVTICACSHVGMVDEGCRLFDSMKEVYGIHPKLEHYGCLVDLLGRAGRLKEAEERVRAMPMAPNAILWRSFLGAARIHGDTKLGEVALENLIQLEPKTSGNYVLLSNIYASIGRFDDVKKVRKLMKDKKVDKMPGTSLVEINGAMHEFLIGDKTHPRSKEIYLKLEEMSRRLHESGHKPRTRDVLFDIEEEEKEDALSYHSERLAIAFALIASDSYSSIRIIKNLRVCGDCHASTKLVSKIYDREIIVRDRSRFHHFKDGACSCLDYW